MDTADVDTADVDTADVDTADVDTADVDTADVDMADVDMTDVDMTDVDMTDVAGAFPVNSVIFMTHSVGRVIQTHHVSDLECIATLDKCLAARYYGE